MNSVNKCKATLKSDRKTKNQKIAFSPQDSFILEYAVKQIRRKWTKTLSASSRKFYCKTVKVWKKGNHFRIYVPYSAVETAGFVSITPVKGSKFYRGLYLKPTTVELNVKRGFRLTPSALFSKSREKKLECLKKFVDDVYDVLAQTGLREQLSEKKIASNPSVKVRR